MKKYILGIVIMMYGFTICAQVKKIYVSNNGTDNCICQLPKDCCGSYQNPCKTLEGAYNRICYPGQYEYHIVIKDDGGPVQISSGGTSGFTWSATKSGSQFYPIKIFSENCFSEITRTQDYGIGIYLKANYITFSGLHFRNFVHGAFLFDDADYNSIQFCKFSGDNIVANHSGGVIWIGENCQGNSSSKFNNITHNFFYDLYTDNPQSNQFHVVYLSNKAENNHVSFNTISSNLAQAVVTWHGDFNNNTVSYNVIRQKLSLHTPLVLSANFNFDVCKNGFYDPSVIQNNIFYNNYSHYQSNTPVFTVHPNLNSSNSGWNNWKYQDAYPHDPYWLGYIPNQITGKLVAGDFNRDGIKNDIMALYDNGNGSTSLHRWTKDNVSNRAFIYENPVWTGSTYTASMVDDRVVSGDFDNDFYEDDIAAFYNYGNSTTQIHMWNSNGFLTPQVNFTGNWWSWSTPYINYDVSRITGRVVSGDFDGDQFKDDIAAIYDNGNGSSTFHVWKSNGQSLNYQWSTGWLNLSNYNANQTTGRVVSGDFNGDGIDDIATFYDYGNSQTQLHVFYSTGTSFTSAGNLWSWSTPYINYDVSLITSRVVSGRFNNDNLDDIAAIYKKPDGSSTFHVWLSNGNQFSYQNSTGWWSNNGYGADNIEGRIVSGDFDPSSSLDDLTAFYDYSSSCGSVRTHVFGSTGSSFSQLNYSLGFPWVNSYPYYRQVNENSFENNINFKANDLDEMCVFPNPTKGIVNILNAPEEVSRIIIYNSFGEVVKSIHSPNNEPINIEGQPSGIYFLHVGMCSGSTSNFKLIKF